MIAPARAPGPSGSASPRAAPALRWRAVLRTTTGPRPCPSVEAQGARSPGLRRGRRGASRGPHPSEPAIGKATGPPRSNPGRASQRRIPGEVEYPGNAMVRGATSVADDPPAGTPCRPSGRPPSQPCPGGALGRRSRAGGSSAPGRSSGGPEPVDDPTGPSLRQSAARLQLCRDASSGTPSSDDDPRPAAAGSPFRPHGGRVDRQRSAATHDRRVSEGPSRDR